MWFTPVSPVSNLNLGRGDSLKLPVWERFYVAIFREIALYRPKVRIANPQISRGSGAQRPGYRPTRVLHATVRERFGSTARASAYGHTSRAHQLPERRGVCDPTWSRPMRNGRAQQREGVEHGRMLARLRQPPPASASARGLEGAVEATWPSTKRCLVRVGVGLG